MTRYIASDTAKCAGNPTHVECRDCLRRLLPVNPDAYRQTWMGPWVLDDEPCPSRWTEKDNRAKDQPNHAS